MRVLFVLIDTWWNVNQYLYDSPSVSTDVLIDTWWNVNNKCDIVLKSTPFVLIDTWWNVNYSYYEAVGNVDGF